MAQHDPAQRTVTPIRKHILRRMEHSVGETVVLGGSKAVKKMNGFIYLVGLVVVVGFILNYVVH